MLPVFVCICLRFLPCIGAYKLRLCSFRFLSRKFCIIFLLSNTRGHFQNFMGDSRGGERDHYLEQVRGEAGSEDESSEDEDFNPDKASGGSDVDEEYVAGRAMLGCRVDAAHLLRRTMGTA